MPFVMLKNDRPGSFRRTIVTGKKGKEVKTVKVFTRGVPVELTPTEVDALRKDIGTALVPVEFDAKGRPRVITDEVVADDVTVKEQETHELEPTH